MTSGEITVNAAREVHPLTLLKASSTYQNRNVYDESDPISFDIVNGLLKRIATLEEQLNSERTQRVEVEIRRNNAIKPIEEARSKSHYLLIEKDEFPDNFEFRLFKKSEDNVCLIEFRGDKVEVKIVGKKFAQKYVSASIGPE